MRDNPNSNPLYGLEIGSIAFATTGEFGTSAINGNISRLIRQQEAVTSMTGESGYVYKDSLNQGSLGVAGNYGVSGISKVKCSLAGYIGKGTVTSRESVDIQYNALVKAGVEFIDFDKLQITSLLLALNESQQYAAIQCLSAYLALRAELAKRATPDCDSDCTLRRVIQQPDASDKTAQSLLQDWIGSVDDFTRDFGEGLVVGVVWGGIGTVTTNIRKGKDAGTWKYGAAGEFKYSGLAASVSVKATYDGSQSWGEGKVTVSTDGYSSGSCVAGLVSEWLAEVRKLSLAQLGDASVMNMLPKVADKVEPPTIPEFRKPVPTKEEKSITDKIGEIKDLNGLQALAKASAYEAAKKDRPTLTLDAFLNEAPQQAKTERLDTTIEKVQQNNFSVLDGEKAVRSTALTRLPAAPSEVEKPAQGDGMAGHVPLGVWISNWADLFPWLATGYCNNITDDAGADVILKRRMMIQDFQTLSKLYYMASQCHLSIFTNPGGATEISDSFAQRCVEMQEELKGELAHPDLKKEPAEVIKEAFDGLSAAAQTIYRKWDDLKFLRGCELGLGVVYEGENDGRKLTIKNEATTGTYTFYRAIHFAAEPCAFSAGGAKPNYSAFASSVKVFPVIAPNGNLYAFGPGNMAFWHAFGDGFEFSEGTPEGYRIGLLQADKTNRLLEWKSESGQYNVKMYPIPFSAATGIQWKGESLSTNLSSMRGLNEQLTSVKKELSAKAAWTFSSGTWDLYRNWTPATPYVMSRIKPQYIGLVPETRNIFPR